MLNKYLLNKINKDDHHDFVYPIEAVWWSGESIGFKSRFHLKLSACIGANALTFPHPWNGEWQYLPPRTVLMIPWDVFNKIPRYLIGTRDTSITFPSLWNVLAHLADSQVPFKAHLNTTGQEELFTLSALFSLYLFSQLWLYFSPHMAMIWVVALSPENQYQAFTILYPQC